MDATLALGILIVASLVYQLGSLVAMARFRLARSAAARSPASSAGISVLKPALWAGPGFEALLRTHATQSDADFEILVGIHPADDETRQAVRSVQAAIPDVPIEIVECPESSLQLNSKVQILDRLAKHASKPIWVITDADIGVPQDYLRTISAELSTRGTGLVTCLYCCEPGPSLASRLESVRINTEFSAQVLVARDLHGMRFALGSTLALRRETIRNLGGLASLQEFVGDDYVLGAKVANLGLRVELSSLPVTTWSSRNDGVAEVWRRQLRWSRTIRKQRPAGHAGLFVTFSAAWSMLALLVQPAGLWPLALLGFLARLGSGLMSANLVGSTRSGRDVGLVAIADIIALAIWMWSYCGNTVTWAGRRLRLGRGGRIVP